jgi:hypothetical protein
VFLPALHFLRHYVQYLAQYVQSHSVWVRTDNEAPRGHPVTRGSVGAWAHAPAATGASWALVVCGPLVGTRLQGESVGRAIVQWGAASGAWAPVHAWCPQDPMFLREAALHPGVRAALRQRLRGATDGPWGVWVGSGAGEGSAWSAPDGSAGGVVGTRGGTLLRANFDILSEEQFVSAPAVLDDGDDDADDDDDDSGGGGSGSRDAAATGGRSGAGGAADPAAAPRFWSSGRFMSRRSRTPTEEDSVWVQPVPLAAPAEADGLESLVMGDRCPCPVAGFLALGRVAFSGAL